MQIFSVDKKIFPQVRPCGILSCRENITNQGNFSPANIYAVFYPSRYPWIKLRWFHCHRDYTVFTMLITSLCGFYCRVVFTVMSILLLWLSLVMCSSWELEVVFHLQLLLVGAALALMISSEPAMQKTQECYVFH